MQSPNQVKILPESQPNSIDDAAAQLETPQDSKVIAFNEKVPENRLFWLRGRLFQRMNNVCCYDCVSKSGHMTSNVIGAVQDLDAEIKLEPEERNRRRGA